MDTLISFVGGLITGLAISYAQRRTDDHRKFRAAFTGELSHLREMEIASFEAAVFHFLQSAYPKHEAAYLEYLHSLGWDCITKKSLRRRWEAYRGEYFGDLEDQQYRLAHFISESGEEERQKRDEAILLIENLIA